MVLAAGNRPFICLEYFPYKTSVMEHIEKNNPVKNKRSSHNQVKQKKEISR